MLLILQSARVLANHRDATTVLKNRNEEFDVLILDLSANRPDDWQTLDQICRLTATKMPPQMILCFSTVFRGARMKLEVERRGARLVYVR